VTSFCTSSLVAVLGSRFVRSVTGVVNVFRIAI